MQVGDRVRVREDGREPVRGLTGTVVANDGPIPTELIGDIGHIGEMLWVVIDGVDNETYTSVMRGVPGAFALASDEVELVSEEEAIAA